MAIEHRLVPDEELALPDVLDDAFQTMHRTQRPFALILRKGLIHPHSLQTGSTPFHSSKDAAAASMADSRTRLCADDALRAIKQGASEDDLILATTGYTGRALYALGDADNQFYMVGSMGCLASFALGLAIAQPDRRIIAIEGDGALLMRMGNLATLGHHRPPNLLHVLLDNGVHDSTGAQATAASTVNFAAPGACVQLSQRSPARHIRRSHPSGKRGSSQTHFH